MQNTEVKDNHRALQVRTRTGIAIYKVDLTEKNDISLHSHSPGLLYWHISNALCIQDQDLGEQQIEPTRTIKTLQNTNSFNFTISNQE